MKHKKHTAPSTKHPKAKALQSLHGVSAVPLIGAGMMMHNGGINCAPGDANHPSNAMDSSGGTTAPGTPAAPATGS